MKTMSKAAAGSRGMMTVISRSMHNDCQVDCELLGRYCVFTSSRAGDVAVIGPSRGWISSSMYKCGKQLSADMNAA